MQTKHRSSSFLLSQLAQSAQRVVAMAHLVRLVLSFPPLEVRNLIVQDPSLVLHHPLLVSYCGLGERTSQILLNQIYNRGKLYVETSIFSSGTDKLC